jgi:hypothetical protein
MPTVQEVRTALADAIGATGLRSAPMWQDTFTAPIAIITRREFDPRARCSRRTGPPTSSP